MLEKYNAKETYDKLKEKINCIAVNIGTLSPAQLISDGALMVGWQLYLNEILSKIEVREAVATIDAKEITCNLTDKYYEEDGKITKAKLKAEQGAIGHKRKAAEYHEAASLLKNISKATDEILTLIRRKKDQLEKDLTKSNYMV